MKKILDINKLAWNKVEVEYFDGKINSPNYATRTVTFPSQYNASGAYIHWFGNKKNVEGLFL